MGKKKSREWPPNNKKLPVYVIDNHTHLPLREEELIEKNGLKLTCEDQIDLAYKAGVKQLITSGCEYLDLDLTLDLALKYENVYAALAIHPNEAPLHSKIFEIAADGLEPKQDPLYFDVSYEDAFDKVATLCKNDAVLAVGETGLDYFRTGPLGVEKQKEAFRDHIALAKELDKPLQIHDRDAHADVVEILLKDKAPERTVFHCFSGGKTLAQYCAENKWMASFAGPITYKANEDLRKAFLEMPRELVLVETDAPYLTPEPYRGCPNSSYVMVETVEAMAKMWNEDIFTTSLVLQANTQRTYELPVLENEFEI